MLDGANAPESETTVAFGHVLQVEFMYLVLTRIRVGFAMDIERERERERERCPWDLPKATQISVAVLL